MRIKLIANDYAEENKKSQLFYSVFKTDYLKNILDV